MIFRLASLIAVTVVVAAFARAGYSAEPSGDPETLLKVEVVHLKSAPVEMASNLVQQAKLTRHIASDRGTNTVVMAGSERELATAKKFLANLEKSWKAANPTPQVDPNVAAMQSMNQRMITGRSGSSAANSSQQKLAEQYRNAESSGAKDQMELVKRDLRQSIESDFEQRQQEDEIEVSSTRERIDGLEKSVKARAAAKDQIIDNRLREILQPEFQWTPPGGRSNRINFGGLQNLQNINGNQAVPFRAP